MMRVMSDRDFTAIGLQSAIQRVWGARFAGSRAPAWVMGIFGPMALEQVERGRDMEWVAGDVIDETIALMQSYGHELPVEATIQAR